MVASFFNMDLFLSLMIGRCQRRTFLLIKLKEMKVQKGGAPPVEHAALAA